MERNWSVGGDTERSSYYSGAPVFFVIATPRTAVRSTLSMGGGHILCSYGVKVQQYTLFSGYALLIERGSALFREVVRFFTG